ncbi:hypothetical protein [Nocardiopsis chromatogenes]|uniref:hypothetical protein n=1 Tax=Nocardiopsis chromatogenes TaxID=280239 RepID=UPI001360B5CA
MPPTGPSGSGATSAASGFASSGAAADDGRSGSGSGSGAGADRVHSGAPPRTDASRRSSSATRRARRSYSARGTMSRRSISRATSARTRSPKASRLPWLVSISSAASAWMLRPSPSPGASSPAPVSLISDFAAATARLRVSSLRPLVASR